MKPVKKLLNPTINVIITNDDLKDAKYTDNDNCPLAKALKRTLNHEYLYVGGFHIDIYKDISYSKVIATYCIPEEWIHSTCKNLATRTKTETITHSIKLTKSL